MWSVILAHPVLLLFAAAVVLTVLRRASQSVFASETSVSARELQESITVVACVPPRASIAPYVDLLATARWPTRVCVHLFKALAPDETVPHVDDKRVRLGLRYGDYDEGKERARIVEAARGATYVLVLARPVHATTYGWDDALVALFGSLLSSRRPVLTCVPAAHATFLHIDETSKTVSNRVFRTPPTRPQPSPLWSARMSFCRSEDVVPVATSDDVSGTRTLWRSGCDFFVPHVPVFTPMFAPALHAPGASPPVKAHDTNATARTEREWLAFVGRSKDGDAWTRRAYLGLTPRASHEERYAKYGDQLGMHGL